MSFLQAAEFKVGALVVSVLVLIGAMSMQVSEDPGFMKSSKTHWFELKDAAGLLKNSSVKMAGINVGVIKDIKLKKGKAFVELQLDEEIPITTETKIEIRANGILGDKYIEIVTEDLAETPLQEGAQITNVDDSSSLGSLISSIGKISASLEDVAEALRKGATKGDNSTPIGRIIGNIETLTADLAEISTQNKGKINESMDSIHRIVKTLDELVNDESEDGFRVAWYKATHAIDKADRSMQNLEEITDKVNRGDGTIGKLINDDTTVKELNTAIQNVNQFLGTSSVMRTTIDFHSSYLSRASAAKSNLSLLIQPGLDRHYELGIIDDPEGVTKNTITTIDNGSGTTVEDKKEQLKNEIKFTALYAKRYFNFIVKGGLIESSGGFGVDYYVYKDQLRWSLELFDFRKTNLRSSLRWTPFRGVYLVGGGEDLMNKGDGSTAFFGAGIYLTNDDLKILMTGLSLQ